MTKKQLRITQALVLIVIYLFFAIQNELPSLPIISPPIPSVVPSTHNQEPTIEIATVSAVIDGDTIELTDKRRVRYIGIDTPETKHPNRGVECFGVEAAQKNKELVEGKTITIQKDISETDRYKRLLRYVWIGDLFVNDYLVREGYAVQSTFPPDVRYATQFSEAAQDARDNNRGLWSECK